MDVITDDRVKKTLESLSSTERGRIQGYIDLFVKNKFLLRGKYLKKLKNSLWELRPGNIRVLFGIVDQNMAIVNIFKKKTQKTPKQEIKIAENRLRERKI
ncbi:MAG: hypothetical protein A2868_00160 [Candidatus Levybacteria bacterium RIFCSPHIGHO2_01_FULL_40_15b]|nr:MAG: hypothetical protein A2868_00160 [Candidatus Levybacteria bacterium RIFCSPHIGHO2_01_FULL_40_15b]